MPLPGSFKRLLAMLHAGVACGLISVLLGLAPFAVAQDVHHELAVADTDGHEHSDNDLCQWVQHHTTGSLDFDAPSFRGTDIVSPSFPFFPSLPSCSATLSLGPPRAPPCQ